MNHLVDNNTFKMDTVSSNIDEFHHTTTKQNRQIKTCWYYIEAQKKDRQTISWGENSHGCPH